MLKKWTSILLSVIMLLSLSAGAEADSAPGTRMGFEVLKMVYDGEQNQVVSPVSLACALAMAAQGAEGATRQELLDALEAERAEDVAAMIQPLTDAGLKLADAAFLVNDLVPREEYVEALRERFGAEWFESATVDEINAWVAEKTDGLIERIVEELSDDARLALVNAAAMDAKWALPFDPERTADGTFHAPDGDVTVAFMHDERWADYGERDGVQLLRMRYSDSGLTLLIALPEADGMDGVLNGLCAEGLGYFQFNEEPARVNLSMPKTDISAENGLNDALQALGVQTAFGDDADFSGISEEALKIGSVLQKARLVFDEDGTKAAAATALIMEAMSAVEPMDVVDFTMDRPFAAVIADENTGVVCFAGIVANPVEIN